MVKKVFLAIKRLCIEYLPTGYFCYSACFLVFRNGMRYLSFFFFCVYTFTILSYSDLFLIKISYADVTLPGFGFKIYIFLYWLSTFVIFLNNECYFVLSIWLRRALKSFNWLNHLLVGDAFLKTLGLVDGIQYLNSVKFYAGALTLYAMPNLSHFLKITATNPTLSNFNCLTDQEKVSAWQAYKTEGVGITSIQEHVLSFTEAVEARILASELAIKTLKESVLLGEQKALALKLALKSVESDQEALQMELMSMANHASSQNVYSVATSPGYFWPAVILFGCGAIAFLIHNEINPLALIQNFCTERVALDRANLEVIQANARRVHNHGMELEGLQTDVIFQKLFQEQTADCLISLSAVSKTSGLRLNNFSLETLDKLELLSNDIATLKVAGCCLEQKVSELQIVNKFLLETASITGRSLLQNISE
jgi:hypothetical protein